MAIGVYGVSLIIIAIVVVLLVVGIGFLGLSQPGRFCAFWWFPDDTSRISPLFNSFAGIVRAAPTALRSPPPPRHRRRWQQPGQRQRSDPLARAQRRSGGAALCPPPPPPPLLTCALVLRFVRS